MVQCSLQDDCRRRQWYHIQCLSPEEQSRAAQATWYCSESCLHGAEHEDHVQNYSKAMIWEGLQHLARRDAVQEGDGEAMTEFWKLNMIQFWDRKHPNYFTIAFRMLAGIEGFYPERIQQDLKWNRVANLQGQAGGNIALDLVNEILNNEVKEMAHRSRGMYTDRQIQRCAETSGAFGKDLDRIFAVAGVGNSVSPQFSSGSAHKRIQADVAQFVSEYGKDGLFAFLPGRSHQGFDEFTYPRNIRDPQRMGELMKSFAKDMDLWRDNGDSLPVSAT
ncbi:uncharacterized protein LOC144539769 [Centroberyx gerrardi]